MNAAEPLQSPIPRNWSGDKGPSALTVGRSCADDEGMFSGDDGYQAALSHAECVELLRTKSVGRIGLSASSLPVVVPVRYVVHEDRIVLGAERDSRVAMATRDAVVAFEVDDFDHAVDSGWVVMVQGLARELDGDTPVDPAGLVAGWADCATAQCFAVPMEIVSGRRLGTL